MKKTLSILLLIASFISGFAQDAVIGDKSSTAIRLGGKQKIRSYATINNGDTMAIVHLHPVYIIEKRQFKNVFQANKYGRLVRNVKKTYPYAKIAGKKMKDYNKMIAGKSEAEKKRLMAKAEKELVDQFEKDIRNMTFTQGHILLKLIDRETGNTSYQIIKEMRGSLSATLWQSLAKVFSTDLKAEYDPDGDDKQVEEIVQLIERGEI
jgi:hypothetical protein